MNDVYIGKGKLHGKGVYASRDFKVGEVVKHYNLRKISKDEFDRLGLEDRQSVHSFWGQMYLFPEPSRYTNHSANPNTKADLKNMCDIAVKPINRGDMITTNATMECRAEVKTFIENMKRSKISDFLWLSGGYRNARVKFKLKGSSNYEELALKRVDGNFKIVT